MTHTHTHTLALTHTRIQTAFVEIQHSRAQVTPAANGGAECPPMIEKEVTLPHWAELCDVVPPAMAFQAPKGTPQTFNLHKIFDGIAHPLPPIRLYLLNSLIIYKGQWIHFEFYKNTATSIGQSIGHPLKNSSKYLASLVGKKRNV